MILKDTKITKNILFSLSTGNSKRDPDNLKYWVLPKYSIQDQAFKIYTPKQVDKHPFLFHIGAPPPPPPLGFIPLYPFQHRF